MHWREAELRQREHKACGNWERDPLLRSLCRHCSQARPQHDILLLLQLLEDERKLRDGQPDQVHQR